MWLGIAVVSALILASALLFALGSSFIPEAWMMLPAVLGVVVTLVMVNSRVYTPVLFLVGAGLSIALIGAIPFYARLIPWAMAALHLGIGIWTTDEHHSLAVRVSSTVVSGGTLVFLLLLVNGVDLDLTSIPLFVVEAASIIGWFYWQKTSKQRWKYIPFGGIVIHFLHGLMLLLPAEPLSSLVTALPIALFYGSVLLFVVMHVVDVQSGTLSNVFSIGVAQDDENVPLT